MKNIIVALSVITFVISSAAAEQGKKRQLSDACRAEVKTLCGSAQGREARRACMKENRSKVSDSCRAELKTAMGARKAAKVRAEGETQ